MLFGKTRRIHRNVYIILTFFLYISEKQYKTPGPFCQPRRMNFLSCLTGGQVLADHQSHLEDDGMVKLAQIQPGELLDLLKTID